MEAFLSLHQTQAAESHICCKPICCPRLHVQTPKANFLNHPVDPNWKSWCAPDAPCDENSSCSAYDVLITWHRFSKPNAMLPTWSSLQASSKVSQNLFPIHRQFSRVRSIHSMFKWCQSFGDCEMIVEPQGTKQCPTVDWMIAPKDDATSCNLILNLLNKQACTWSDLLYRAFSRTIAWCSPTGAPSQFTTAKTECTRKSDHVFFTKHWSGFKKKVRAEA